MRKLLLARVVATFMVVTIAAGVLLADGSATAGAAKPPACTTIKAGILEYAVGHYLAGQPLTTGVDAFGYNYQSHQFDGSYANAYLGRDGLPPFDGDDAAYLLANPSAAGKWYWPYRHDRVAMKWNDAWLSNKDCDGNGALDRYYGHLSYVGSGAWLTNHQWGAYEDSEGSQHWTDFTKIVAAPADATKIAGTWYDASGTEIGPAIWGDFAIVQDIYNDSGTGDHGVLYWSPAGPGFGHLD